MVVRSRKDIADLLLERGAITEEHIRKAEEIQRLSGGDDVGNVLVRMEAITMLDLAKARADQWGISFCDLREVRLDPEVVRLIPHSLAIRHKAIALNRDQDRLDVAMADPLNVFAQDELRLVTGLEINALFAVEEDVDHSINEVYGLQLSMEEAVQQDEAAQAVSEIESMGVGDDINAADLRRLVEEAPVVRLVNVIITQAIRDKASDIHVEPHKKDVKVRFRIDGILHDIMNPPKMIQPILLSRIKIMASMDIAEKRIPQDGRIQLVVEGREFDFRVSTYPTIFGEKIVMRILDKSGTRIGLDRLGFQSETKAIFEDLLENPYGILLVTGPTGSGKTTTLYSALNKLNTIEKNIITIEDPIEYQMDGINQIQINEKAGLTFSLGLRHIVRQDPDIIMVGEIRDSETAEIAINAALTGHLVLSTLHTNDAAGATTRLIDMGIEPFLVASSTIGILAQRLVRNVCGHCKESYEAPSLSLRKFGVVSQENETITLYRGRGCEMCRGTGYSGRAGIFELMYIDDAIREMIVKKDSSGAVKNAARKAGMKTLQEDCLDKILMGFTTVEEAIRVIFVEEKIL